MSAPFRSLPPWRKRIATSVRVGLAIGVAFSLVAGVWFLVTGGERLRANGISYVEVMLTYIGAGVLGGLAVALMLPLRRFRLGAAVLGFLTVLPLYAGAALVMLPRDQWFPLGTVAGIISALVIGVPLGLLSWTEQHRP